MSSGLAAAFNVSGSSSTASIGGSGDKDKEALWYFSAEQLANSPSRRHGIDGDVELSYRQQSAYLIQEMGQRLQVSQLCINTAIVYMHRFYAFHSFTHFHRNGIAAASLFLAAKVEEQPRKLEHVIKAANKCLNQTTSSTTDAYYLEQAQDLVFNENVLLQTLGFDVAIDHPHTHVVKTCHLVKACKELAQTSYFLASNSLHLTSMCLQYRPTVVACFCIYLACKWTRWEISQSIEGKHWFNYVDKTVTMDLLKQLTDEFIAIYEKSPARLKSKLNSIKALAQGAGNRAVNKDKKNKPDDWKMVDMMKMYHSSINTNEPSNVNSTLNSISMPSSSDQQPQQQSGQAALLPPPPPHSHQQIRRSADSHSSQHRAHHSLASTHHHSKQAFSANEVPDPKATSTSHKQAHSSSSSVSRPREHSQYTQNVNAISIIPTSSTSSARSNVSAAAAAAAANTSNSRPIPPCGTVSQKLPSQSHEPNFHKPRERSNLSTTSNAPNALLQSHKIPQKSDVSRIIVKEHMERIAEQNKSNSKLFASSTMSLNGSTQLSGGAPDITRNIIQQHQRLPPPGYHQSTRSSGKQDQSAALQRQQQLPSQHKHSLTLETQFNSSTSEVLQAQSLHAAAAATLHSNARPNDSGQNNEESNTDSAQSSFSSLLTFPGFKTQAAQQQTKMPLISPELSDPMQQQQQQHHHQHMLAGGNSNNRKAERERGLGTPTKKDRSRVAYPGLDQTTNQTTTVSRSNSQSSQKLQMPKKLDTGGSISNVLAGTSAAAAYSGMKRPNESLPILQDNEFSRDIKMRKLDANSSTNILGQTYSDSRNSSTADSNKLQIVNGIETNPDLVRTLLKESLCTANALIKTEPLSSASALPPSQLLHQPTHSLLKDEKATTSSIQGSMDANEGAGSSKSEKKKKKEKHKHKEKDKAKDRDERKRHKKDKDRHKSREMEPAEHVKIKISKEKLESVGNSGGGDQAGSLLKIKIPKDRINSELNLSGGNGNNNNATACLDNSTSANVTSPPALKIKISKEKLESYSSGGIADAAPPVFNILHSQAMVNTSAHGNAAVGSISNASGRKKERERERERERDRDRDRDREREREKEKKRNVLEHNKLMANGSGGALVGGPSYAQPPIPCPKSTSSSKF